MNRVVSIVFCVVVMATAVSAQSNAATEPPKKANARAAAPAATNTAEPFEGATVEKMASQCVTLETELGAIEIALMPEVAPEAVRNFLNLSATGALDTTTFSRVVKRVCHSRRQSFDERKVECRTGKANGSQASRRTGAGETRSRHCFDGAYR